MSVDGTLRYEGLSDVKTVGVHTERLSRAAARQVRSAPRDFLAEPANLKIDDDGSGTPCFAVEEYEADRRVRSRSEPLRANSSAALLRIVDRLATPKKWACPGRLSAVPGFRSAKYCSEQPAFMMTAAGQSACELTRHVEAYLDGTVYVATYGPHLKQLQDHRYYEIGASAITSLVDAINTFETTPVELLHSALSIPSGAAEHQRSIAIGFKLSRSNFWIVRRVNFWKSGTSEANRIKYFAYPGERPVLDFSNLRIHPDPDYTFGVNVSGSYLHLKGFEIRYVPMNTPSNNGVRVGGDAYRNIFELLDIHQIKGAGIFIHTTRGGHLILNSDAHDNYDPQCHQGNGQNGDGFGVHYQKSGDVTVFRGCRAWWNSDDGWDFISQEVPVIVENSWAMGRGYINSGTARAPDGNGAGFKIGSSKTGIRHVVRNNLAWGNRSQGFYANHSAGSNDWLNNTSYNNGVQYDLLASSWDANGNRTDGVILTGDKVNRMRNNIGFPNSNRNMQGVQSSFNTWDLGLTPASSDLASLADSGFMGPRNADGSLPNLSFLKLRAGSRMIAEARAWGFRIRAPLPIWGRTNDDGLSSRGGVPGC